MANRGLCTALSAVGAAQLLKLPMHYAVTGEWDMRKLIGTGGMPSSHSSGVTALAAYTAAKYGLKTPAFAISAMLGIVVMYDAMNIRRHAGEIAVQVNDLDEDVEKLSGEHPGIYHKRRREKLKETLGHQPREVAAGALLGACIGLIGALTSAKGRA
ncbi:divergent PAP2 family protein [Paenibacillus arenilitoris]|uniref:Divergent PAP2 family protein n=1 Tax=Paenibacillus arenilitoris TaxID=2772299 RepID=A0A927CLW1_9BACL|nr:divergent PAP2 family protein [Paenibacillus arenilitoris]MBD2869212.1 divergent PAP2 family protein [Paenibacillus arenilitoris]